MQVEFLYLHLFGRPPTDREREVAATLLMDSPLPDLCLALLNTNEAIHVD